MLDPASMTAPGGTREVELLDLLQRVRLGRHSDGLADNSEEVDEHVASQQVVDLVFAGAVRAHEPPERARLVGRVVIDVHVGVPVAPLRDQIDRRLGTRRVLRSGCGPRTRGTSVRRRQPRRARTGTRVPPSSAYGSPSRSRNRSPGEGVGRAAKPRGPTVSSSTSGCRSSWSGGTEPWPRSCSDACRCSFSYVAGLIPEPGSSPGPSPSARRVLIPAATSRRRCSRRIPATSER